MRILITESQLNSIIDGIYQTEDIIELYNIQSKIFSKVNDEIDEFEQTLNHINDANERSRKVYEFRQKKYREYEVLEDKIIERISEIEKSIYSRIKKMYEELGVKKKTYSWGGGWNPADGELGRPFGDDRGAIFLKESEKIVEDEDGDEREIYDGVEVELIVVKKEFRGKGVAKDLMTRLVNAADKYKVKLYIKIAPQEDDVNVEGLKGFYESFGFVFDGIGGYRLLK